MAIIDTILSTPTDIPALRKSGAALESVLDSTFNNFLFYAKKNWQYTASSKAGGQDLLDGNANATPCGGIAYALRLVFTNGLGVPSKDVKSMTISGYVWTGPNYLCFDPLVRGNLRRLDTPGDYKYGCIFNQHFYLQCNGKYYDPCLSVTYKTLDESAKEKFPPPSQSFGFTDNRKLLVTKDRKTCILYIPQDNVHGFVGAWAMFDTSKKNIENAMGSKSFKTELADRRGTAFAQFINTLPV